METSLKCASYAASINVLIGVSLFLLFYANLAPIERPHWNNSFIAIMSFLLKHLLLVPASQMMVCVYQQDFLSATRPAVWYAFVPQVRFESVVVFLSVVISWAIRLLASARS